MRELLDCAAPNWRSSFSDKSSCETELKKHFPQYTLDKTEGLKIMVQKKASSHPWEVKRQTVKEREEEQSSSWKKELSQIQLDESSAGTVLPCAPALAYQPAMNKPLECHSLPAQSSQVIWKTTGKKTPEEATDPAPVGRPSAKSTKPSPEDKKPKPAPLMKKAKKMMTFLQERHLNKSLKGNRRSKVILAQCQQLGTSSALSTWEPKFPQPQPSVMPQETSSSPRQGPQRSLEPEDSLIWSAHRHTQKSTTLTSAPRNAVGKSIQRSPTEGELRSSSMVKTTVQHPCAPALPCQPARKRPVNCVSLPAQSSQVIWSTTGKMTPEEATWPPPVGEPPVKSTKGATKRESTPLMKEAKKMRTCLQERDVHKSLVKGFPESPSPAHSSWEPKPSKSQPSRRPGEPTLYLRQEAQESSGPLVRNLEGSLSRCAFSCTQEPPTLSSSVLCDVKKSIQRSPLDKETCSSSVVQSTSRGPLAAPQPTWPKGPRKRLNLSVLYEDLYLSSSSEDEEEQT